MGLITIPTLGEEIPQVRLHPNAKLTPVARRLLVDRVEKLGWAVARAARGLPRARPRTRPPGVGLDCPFGAYLTERYLSDVARTQFVLPMRQMESCAQAGLSRPPGARFIRRRRDCLTYARDSFADSPARGCHPDALRRAPTAHGLRPTRAPLAHRAGLGHPLGRLEPAATEWPRPPGPGPKIHENRPFANSGAI
jgi:hypothetical protein